MPLSLSKLLSLSLDCEFATTATNGLNTWFVLH